MTHSKNFTKVKRYYTLKVWDIERVRNAVSMGWITPEEFEEITGEVFTVEETEE